MFELEDHYWWFVGRRELALNLLEQNVDAAHGFPLLDIGCGTGAVLKEAKKLSRPVGADFTDLALRKCRQRDLNDLVLADATSLPFENDSFQAVVGLDIFEHVEDDRRAIAEAFRVLKPGGVLVLSVPAFRALWGPHDIALHHFRRYRLSEMDAILRENGFEIAQISYAVFWLFPLVLISRVVEKLRKGPAHASLPTVPDWMNKLLITLLAFEGKLLWRRSIPRYPWGSSVVAVGRKPK